MSPAQPVPGLRLRRLADKDGSERVVRFDPETGARKLVNPATPGDAHEPWPTLGWAIEGDPPKRCSLSTAFVAQGVAEGWIELDNPQMAHRPGGPPENRWRVTHSFTHADAVILRTVDGEVRYRVIRQPDKYAVTGYETGDYGEEVPIVSDKKTVTDEMYANGDTAVSHYFVLELET